MRSKLKQRIFDRKTTVFAPFKPDVDEDFIEICEHDTALYKIPNFITDEEDQ